MPKTTHQDNDLSFYPYFADADRKFYHEYLLPVFFRILDGIQLSSYDRKVFDLGCGNGATAVALEEKGYSVVGVDPSERGIRQAKSAHPELRLYQGSAYNNLASQYGQFPVVVSLEVVEHIFFPRKYANCLWGLLKPGGVAIVSTPYHGYWKNLAYAITGRMNAHFKPLWDYGHIKFWSFKSLRTLLLEAEFKSVSFRRVGRVPPLAKSMIAIASK